MPVIAQAPNVRGAAFNPPQRATLPASPPVFEIPPDVEPELVRATPARVPLAEVPTMLVDDPRHRVEVPSGIRSVTDPAIVTVEAVQPLRAPATTPMERGADNATARHGPGAGAATTGPGHAASTRGATAHALDARATGSAAVSRDSGTGRAGAGADAAPAQQRIVALRVMAGEQRWPGAELIAALQGEGLAFGRYSVFHRQRDDGRSIYSVASMVEPGSFDLETIDTQSFPGVSMFALLPGPLDAPTTFDQMLATARRLAERLGGNLQDEHGSSLTAQRILNLREELVHFEHLLSRRPKRS
jgi:cell division protein ZipA